MAWKKSHRNMKNVMSNRACSLEPSNINQVCSKLQVCLSMYDHLVYTSHERVQVFEFYLSKYQTLLLFMFPWKCFKLSRMSNLKET